MGAFKELLETLLAYIAHTSRAAERFAATPQAEYWRGLLNKCNNLWTVLVTRGDSTSWLEPTC